MSLAETQPLSDHLVARNPATGAELGRIPITPPPHIPSLVAHAREAQKVWAATPWPTRREALVRWHRVLLRRSDAIVAQTRDEIGKPAAEALGAEVLASLDHLRWTYRNAGRILSGHLLRPHWQRLMLMPTARLHWRPVGVAGIIGAWNYPFLLNAPLIAHALAAGNAVVWKPSEFACLCGRLLQDTLDAAGLPPGLVQLVQGGPDVGAALASAGVDKLWFTGGLTGGRAVLQQLGHLGIPAVAELSGFDPAIVLPDAPLPKTAAALTWAAFVNAGQSCMAVKRVYVVGDPSHLAAELAGRARALRVGNPAGPGVDLGPMISVTARDRFHAQVLSSLDAGAQPLAGAQIPDGPGAFYPPTVLLAQDESHVQPLQGSFGPAVIVRGVPSVDEAVEASNASLYGLSASVWGQNRHATRSVAQRLDAGMIGINEAVTFFAHLTAPAGGLKASGFGRVHGPYGLLEFASPCSVLERSSSSLRPQLFPYTGSLERSSRLYLRLIHGNRASS